MLEIAFHASADVRGTLFLHEEQVRRLTRVVPKVISITRRLHPERRSVEQLIEGTYACEYDSRIDHHYPTLMSVHDAAGRVLAAVGFRAAADEPLFLEQYLGRPVETALSEATGTEVARSCIIEVGNLASGERGASVFLFVALAAYLRQQNFEYAVVTATDSLRRTFDLFGFTPLDLGSAKAQLLPDGGASWGSYYTRNPKVIAGAIAPSFAQLERFLPAENNSDLGRLFARLHRTAQDTTP